MHFYELHEGDNEVFADLLLAREEEMEAEEFFDVVQSIRRRIIDTFETQTLIEAVADELERDYGFIAVNDERLTAGPDEVRAWPIRDGSTAVDAAGAIHTDLAKGFIRAETVAYEDLLTLGSMAEARKAGRLRSEGKTYRVRDGDVVEILFSK